MDRPILGFILICRKSILIQIFLKRIRNLQVAKNQINPTFAHLIHHKFLFIFNHLCYIYEFMLQPYNLK